jgi:hypothetical protein
VFQCIATGFDKRADIYPAAVELVSVRLWCKA